MGLRVAVRRLEEDAPVDLSIFAAGDKALTQSLRLISAERMIRSRQIRGYDLYGDILSLFSRDAFFFFCVYIYIL